MKIYKITHIDSGKIYIGQTIQKVHKRWSKHVADAEKGRVSTLIGRAINKYGKKAFIIEEICSVLKIEYMNEVEVLCIKQFNSMYPVGYNMLKGGANAYTEKRTEQFRNKISKIQTGRKASLSTRLKMSKSAQERISTQGLSAAQKNSLTLGREAVRGKPSWNKGVKVTNKQTLSRLSESHKGQVAHNKRAIICNETNIEFESGVAAAEALNLSPSKISCILTGKIKSTKGYSFRYK